MSEDKEQDTAQQNTDEDQLDKMDVSRGESRDRPHREEGESEKDCREDTSRFETAPTHHRVYPALPPMDTRLSFLTPSAQPSAPPPPLGCHDDGKNSSTSPKKTAETTDSGSGRDSPRISTLLALRSTRSESKKPTGSPPTAASASSSQTASTILQTLQRGKKLNPGSSTVSRRKHPSAESSLNFSPRSKSSSKRKRSPKHAVSVITNQPSPPPPPMAADVSKPTSNGSKAHSLELDFETAKEGVTKEGGDRAAAKGGGERESGKQSEVIIRTNTYTHLGTKRKSTGAFRGSSSSSDSASSSSESWQTAQAKESGNGSSSSSSPLEPSPAKRLRSVATPTVPSLRRALGESKVIIQQPQDSSRSTASKNGGAVPPAKPVSSSQGHSRSLSIGSGLAAILSRPVSGKLARSPVHVAAQRKQEQAVKKEGSHSWIAQLFHKS